MNNGAIAFPPASLPFWDPEADDTLVCRQVRIETHDVRSFVFEAASPCLFAFRAGQFLTFSIPLPDGTVSRSYTISSPPTRPHRVAITVKRVPGGPVSAWLHDHLRPGVRVQAIGPLGEFTCDVQPREKLLFLSAGSGITPLMAMARAQDDLGAETDLVFVHSARSPEDIIFRRELELMEAHRAGFRAMVVCGRDRPQARWPGYRGRLDAAMLAGMVPDFRERRILLCGPDGYMQAVTRMLREAGFDMRLLASESFDFGRLAEQSPAVAEAESVLEAAHQEPGAAASFSVLFQRSDRTVVCAADRTVLEAARAQGIRLPSSCAKGVCGTCKTRLVSGSVAMTHGGGIRQREIDAGMVLLCCSRPTSDLVVAA